MKFCSTCSAMINSEMMLNLYFFLSYYNSRSHYFTIFKAFYFPRYVARILKVEGRRLFIHYLNWHKRHDQWLPSRSPRIRALTKKNADKLPEEQNMKVCVHLGSQICRQGLMIIFGTHLESNGYTDKKFCL